MSVNYFKDVVVVLSDGIPVWLKSLLLALTILFIGAWALGFNYEAYRAALYLREIDNNSILLSKRSDRDRDVTVNESAEELYRTLSRNTDVIGVGVISLEPEIQPKIIKVIAKDGNKDFERIIRVGSETYISGDAMSLFIANREGITYVKNVTKKKLIMDIGVKSVISMPILYRGICVGSIIVFLGKDIENVNEEEFEFINGNIKIEVHEILENLYYK